MGARKTPRYWILAAFLALWAAEGAALAAEATGEAPGSGPSTSEPSQEPRPGDVTPSVRPPLEPEEPQAPVTPADIPMLQMAPDFSSPALAFGGYFPLPDIEGGIVRYAPFNIRARVNAGIGFNDNVALSNVDKRSSFFFNLSPSVAVSLERPEQRYYAVYRGVYSVYASDSDSNSAAHNLSLQAGDDWSYRLRTLLRYDFLRGADPRGSTNTAVDRTQTWNLHTVRGTVSYGAPDARGRIDGFVGYLNRQYVTDRAVTSVLDYEQYDVGTLLSARVAPKTRATLLISHSELTHANDPGADSSENRYLVGGDWSATDKTQIRAGVGYMTKNLNSAVTPNFSAPSYEVSASWSPRTYSLLSAAARRTFSESNEVGSRYLVVDYVAATWTHAWSERVRSTVGLVYGRQANDGGDLHTETYHTIDAKVSYALHPRLRLGAQFRRDTRTSPDPASEYTRNISVLTLETAL